MRSPSGASGESGTVTAEFAAVVPAVLLVLAGCLACIQVAGQQLRLQDAAAGAARTIARGEAPAAAAAQARRLVPGAALAHWVQGDLACVRLNAGARLGPLPSFTITASSCSLPAGK